MYNTTTLLYSDDMTTNTVDTTPVPTETQPTRIKYDPTRSVAEQFPVGTGVTECLWTDSHAWEVVGHKGSNTILIRKLRPERDQSFKPDWVPGGFAGHCTNAGQQRWILHSDPSQPVLRHTLGKRARESLARSGGFTKHGVRWLIGQATYYHDYNF